MQYVNFNKNGQIWIFVNHNIQGGVISDSNQQLTLLLTLEDGSQVMSTMVYAKCSVIERLRMWDDLYSLSLNISIPWMVGGDFNVILSDEENVGGLPVYPKSMRILHIVLILVIYLMSS